MVTTKTNEKMDKRSAYEVPLVEVYAAETFLMMNVSHQVGHNPGEDGNDIEEAKSFGFNDDLWSSDPWADLLWD